jgi:hypothetical protein
MVYYLQKESDPIEMKNIFNSLYLIIQIFYDLNAQVNLHRKISIEFLMFCFFAGITRTF